MTVKYTVDGKPATRAKAMAAWAERDGNHDSAEWFAKAEEQSSDGYVARDAVECAGVTIRHPNEEQA